MPRRITIGIIGWLLLFVGVGLYFFGPEQDTWRMVCSGCIRVGALMFALWLAYRHLSRVPVWLYGCTVTVLILIAARPKWAFFLGPLIVVVWLVRPRPNRSGDSREKRAER